MGEVIGELRSAGCVFAEDEAALLLDAAADRGELVTMLAQRVTGRPLEQILGWAEFAGLRVRVTPGVFVPRRRSELLVWVAERHLADRSVVVDLCCGSGAIGAALLGRHPSIEVYAADLDPVAVDCARTNLPPERVFAGDLYDALPSHLRGQVNVLVVNAPYVPTAAISVLPREARDHEHHIALDGGADGHDAHRRVAAGVRAWLAPGGLVVIETGRDQTAMTQELLTESGLRTTVHADPDLMGVAVSGLDLRPVAV